MDIKDFLKDDLFIINETFKDKKEALTFFSNVLKEKGYALDWHVKCNTQKRVCTSFVLFVSVH
ncbi:hypothetical protein [Malacoplasma iowae]|uniref:hypothetical protein n=1 Tax=Malacoplasma iowae TaxID=2116 RepID=UPI003872FD98|nr:hypothetical protein QX181_00020 [Malacoplasma iowae]